MTRIIYPVARAVSIPAIGTTVEFDAPNRLWLGRVNWRTSFRFTVGERDYWGHVFADGEVELATRNGTTGYGISLNRHAKRDWRKALAVEGRDLIREARRLWNAALAEGWTIHEADTKLATHYRIQREAKPVAVTLEDPNTNTVSVIARFATIAEAEDFLDTSATVDPDDLEAGRYGVDAPEEMVGPPVVGHIDPMQQPYAVIEHKTEALPEAVAEGQRRLYQSTLDGMGQRPSAAFPDRWPAIPAIKFTKPNGTRWEARCNGDDALADRAYWVQKFGEEESEWLPDIVGFYAATLDEARERLGQTPEAFKQTQRRETVYVVQYEVFYENGVCWHSSVENHRTQAGAETALGRLRYWAGATNTGRYRVIERSAIVTETVVREI